MFDGCPWILSSCRGRKGISAGVTNSSQFAWGLPGFNVESFVSQEHPPHPHHRYAWANLGRSPRGNWRISRIRGMMVERTHSERDSLCKGPDEGYKNSQYSQGSPLMLLVMAGKSWYFLAYSCSWPLPSRDFLPLCVCVCVCVSFLL